MEPRAAGLYVHVPFCASKCRYCDFYSVADTALLPAWQDAVLREAEAADPGFPAFDTLYFGGGTPSLLAPKDVARLVSGLARVLPFSPGLQVTLEANPCTLAPERLAGFRDAGVHRVNLGVQSLSDAELAVLGRRHSARRAREALAWVREAGFAEFGADLIQGVPGQTLPGFLAQLDEVAASRPDHLSCYQLTYEPGTPLVRLRDHGRLRPVSEALGAELFRETSLRLAEHGYVHYEISNYARGMDRASRHNVKYWTGAPYLGLGPAAHSYLAGRRWWNVRDVGAYVRRIAETGRAVDGDERLTPAQAALEELFLSLRMSRGLDTEGWERRHGVPFAQTCGRVAETLAEQGLAKLHGPRFALTLEGMLRADAATARLAACL